MKVGLDVRYLSHGLTGGIHTYLSQLAVLLPLRAPTTQFVFYADAKRPFDLETPFPPNVEARILPWRSRVTSIVNDRRIADWMARDGVDVAHFPANYGPQGPYALVVTVHDALNLFSMRQHARGFGTSPQKIGMMWYLRRHTARALREADHVITVSEQARHDLLSRTPVAPERITAIHHAAADDFRRIDDAQLLMAVRRRFDLRGRFALADGIKNPRALVAAWRRLDPDVRRETSLVFFSRELAPRPELRRHVDGVTIRFVARPSRADVAALMNLTSVFVFPSFYEGFGLPLVEAMSCGAPIVASSRGAIPEVVGTAGLLVDLEDPDELARALGDVLRSEALQDALRAKSAARAREFSWNSAADRTMDVYHEAWARWRSGRPTAPAAR